MQTGMQKTRGSNLVEWKMVAMSLAEKRRLVRGNEIINQHPDYLRITLERVFGQGPVVANLAKDIGWLRGIERGLDTVVLDHLIKRELVTKTDGNRYLITLRGQKIIANADLGKAHG